MKVATLIVDQRHFDEIVSGRCREEVRRVTPKNCRKYAVCEPNGFCPGDDAKGPEYLIPKKYDFVRFHVGVDGEGDSALVRIDDVEMVLDEDETGAVAVDGAPSDCTKWTWVYQFVVYHLGEVVSTETHSVC